MINRYLFIFLSGCLLLFMLHTRIEAQSWQYFKNQSAAFAEAGKTDSAIVYANLALNLTENSFGKNSTVYADDLITLAGLYQTANNYTLAEPTLLQAVMIYKFAMGEGNKYYAAVLNKLAGLYVAMKAYEKAEPIYSQSLAIIKEALGDDHPEYAKTLDAMAKMYELKGDKIKAGTLYIGALAAQKKASGSNGAYNFDSSLNDLYKLYYTEKGYEMNEPLYSEFLAVIKNEFGVESQQYLEALNKFGMAELDLQNYDKALLLLDEAVDIGKKSQGDLHIFYITLVFNLANVYAAIGNYNKAIPLCEEAVELQKEISVIEDAHYAQTLDLLAGLYRKSGDYNKAEPLYTNSLAITEKIYGTESKDYAGALIGLGSFYKELGNFAKAMSCYSHSVAILKRVAGTRDKLYSLALESLAIMFELAYDYINAEQMYTEALKTEENQTGAQTIQYAYYLSNLGSFYEKIGNYTKAESMYISSLNLRAETLGNSHPDYLNSLSVLAALYKKTGRLAEAEPLFKEALNGTKKALGTEHLEYAYTLINMGSFYAATGKYSLAEPLFKEGKKIMLNNIYKNFAFLSEQEKMSYINQNTLAYFYFFDNFYLRCQSSIPSISTEAYDSQLATKGIILSSGIKLKHAVLGSGNQKTITLFEKWNRLKANLAKIYATPPEQRHFNADSLEEIANRYEKELNRISSSFNEHNLLTQTDWKNVQHALGPNDVAIEFSSFNYYNEKRFTDTIQYMALILRAADPYPAMVKLCNQAQLDSLLTSPANTNSSFITGLYRSAVVRSSSNSNINRQQLYKLIWKPFESLLHPGDHIYYSPSGLLHQIAFAAIPFKDDSLLSDRYRLTQLNSTAMLLQPVPPLDQKNMTIAAFGGIKYDASIAELSLNSVKNRLAFVSRSLPDATRGSVFNYLPGTLKEINSIDSLAKVYNVHATIYSGTTATEDTYKSYEYTTSPDIIHIATHGFFFPDPKQNTNVSVTSPESDRQEFRISNNPLNRAGILFAGANHAWKGEAIPNGSEDGILTAYEASNVTLKHTQLVVLSACETALGDIRGSEGVFGLQRAFKAAGANYLMMSLWKVPDNETAEFMKEFYKALFLGNTIEQAYSTAQNTMKNKYRKDPYKWAAFILLR